jgi:hypothetical protein
MLRTLVNGVLKTLKDNILALPGVSSTIGKVFGALTGAGGAAGAGQQAASATQAAQASAAQVAALGANTTATAIDSTTTGVNAASTDVNTGAIVADSAVTTADVIATTADVLATHANTTAEFLLTAAMTKQLATVTWSTIKYSVDSAANTAATTANTAALAANTAATSTEAATNAAGDVAKTAGGLGGIGSAIGSAASGTVGAVVNMVTGAISAVTGIISVFQNMHQETTLNAIEKSTRYLSIGLVEQGDSLLNDSHMIRNTLSDFMAYNWGVQANYFQQICEKLDALIGGGGIPGITTQPKMAMAGGGPEDIITDAGVSLSNDASINVDLRGSTFNGEATDTQVDAIFNRGIDRAKRSGAFRPGTWPR